MKTKALRRVIVTTTGLLVGLCAAAQTGKPEHRPAAPAAERIATLEAQLERTLQRVERLAARVAELERAMRIETADASAAPAGAAAAAPAAPAAASAPGAAGDRNPDLTRLRDTVNQLSAGLGRTGRDNGLPLHGFADVGAAWSGAGDPQRVRGFNGGTLDVYLAPQVGDRAKALIETVFEYEPGGEAHIEVERLQLGYTASDSLTLWAGRFHALIGVWNTLYHHGVHLQPTIARPRFMDFEDRGGVLPTHTVGVWASGKLPLGQGRVNYDVFAGNGPRIADRELTVNTFTDDNAGKLFGVNLAYRPGGAMGGLAVGVHALGTRVDSYASTGATIASTRLRLAGAYLTYDSDDWSAIAELHRLGNRDGAGGARHDSTLWFGQVSRSIGSLTPYLRLERASIDGGDPYFAAQRTGRPYRRTLAGVRYELDTRAALKFEWSHTAESALTQLDADGAALPFAATRYRRAAAEYSIAF